MSETRPATQPSVNPPGASVPPEHNGNGTAALPRPLHAMLVPLLDAIDRQLHPDEGEFVGREFLRNVIPVFLNSRNRMLVMVGSPGIGKTAFASQLVREKLPDSYPYLAHFCSLPDGENPLQFCVNLGRQLKAYLGDDYQLAGTLGKQLNVAVNVNVGQSGNDTRVVGVEIKELKLGDIHPREAFRALVREPLQAYHTRYGAAPGKQPLMIIIDALDRGWQWDGGQSSNIISMLADVQDLPEWVNLICMARPGPAVQALRAQAGVRVWDIDSSNTENLNDIRTYLREKLIGGLSPEAAERLKQALAQATTADGAARTTDSLIEQIVQASQGTFSFVRRYAGALRMALTPVAGQPNLDPLPLLRFEGGSLDVALDASYAALYSQLRTTLDADTGDADQEVLGALAIAYEPLTRPMVSLFSAWSGSTEELQAALNRLEPVLEPGQSGDGQRSYSFYHRGFTDYVRRMLGQATQEHDLRVARLLEQTSSDPDLARYAARHRWDHLMRGLGLNQPTALDPVVPQVPATSDSSQRWNSLLQRLNITALGLEPGQESAATMGDHMLNGIVNLQQVRALAPDPVTQAQVLRMLAARALSPSESDTRDSWATALQALKEAVTILENSRAIRMLKRRDWRVDGESFPREYEELEQTLIALGDAYRVVAQRMDVGGRQYNDWIADRRGIYLLWDMIVRLPLTVYLVFTLARQGVRELYLPGVLQNLGRGQDWTIARLYVLSVSIYRNARALVRRRGDEEFEDDVIERLARTYMMMGAYDASAATYEMLLGRPVALHSPWRKAIWMHALGDVLLARRSAERAAEMLTSALLTFKSQEAPVLQARALSSLASAHALQSRMAELRGDTALSSKLDDTVLVECDEALTAWKDVTRLEGDEGVSVDPALAKSQIGNLLWRLIRTERLGNEQISTAEQLRVSIGERHFPQRFEHPLLRLFRVLATLLLPAFLLFGLLLAVQNQNAIMVDARTDIALQPPLIELNQFPNNLVTGGAAQPGTLTSGDLTQLLAGTNWRQFTPAPPRLSAPVFDFRALTMSALGLLGIYLLLYLASGFLFLFLASPAHHQSRRPGRLILANDHLTWVGQRSIGLWSETIRWLGQEAILFSYRLRRWVTRAIGLTPQRLAVNIVDQRLVVPFTQIDRVVALERRERRRLLGDFSAISIELNRNHATAQLPYELHIPGSLIFYDEVSDELRQRLGKRWQLLTVDILRSVSGFLFFLTLLYTVLLSLLSPLIGMWLQMPLPWIGYAVSDLYVMTAPGLLMPLLWWFLIHPLGAWVARGQARLALLLTTILGVLLTALVLLTDETANLVRVRPDLLTPALASGVLIALVLNMPVRPLYRAFKPGWAMLRTAIALAALAGLFLMVSRMGLTLAWFDSMVRGTVAVRTGLNTCRPNQACEPMRQAVAFYDQMVCFQPGATEGYAYRGFAHVAQGDFAAARQDFYDAINTAEGRPPVRSGCFAPVRRSGTQAELARLHANLAATSTLQARQQVAFTDSDQLYQEALLHNLQALALSSGNQSPANAILARMQPGETLHCHDLARELLTLTPEQARGLSTPKGDVLADNQATFMLQLADTCYNRGFSQARALPDTSFVELANVSRSAWDDLTAAVAQYAAVADRSNTADERQIARRGMAAAWLILGQFDPLPAGAPDQRSYLLRAFQTFGALAQSEHPDEPILAGKAWSIILLDGWNDASEPIQQALQSNPTNPTYPAMQGLVDWLDSTKYRPPSRSVPSPEYSQAIQQALANYTRAINLSSPPRSQAYATRSVLFYNLRNSPRGEEYQDADFGYWMLQALADMDQALLLADQEGLPAREQVGYRYWRGRLSFSLAVMWQRKLRGLHTWNELVPLYSRAVEDYSAAVVADPESRRRVEYTQLRLPWATYMLNNAVHLQAAEQALHRGEYQLARNELELVEPLLTNQQKQRWDRLSEPRPEYNLLHGLVSLALEEPQDFVNPQTEVADAEASLASLVDEISDDSIVELRSRKAFIQYALNELDRVVEQAGLTESGREIAERSRTRLLEALAAAEQEGEE